MENLEALLRGQCGERGLPHLYCKTFKPMGPSMLKAEFTVQKWD